MIKNRSGGKMVRCRHNHIIQAFEDTVLQRVLDIIDADVGLRLAVGNRSFDEMWQFPAGGEPLGWRELLALRLWAYRPENGVLDARDKAGFHHALYEAAKREGLF